MTDDDLVSTFGRLLEAAGYLERLVGGRLETEEGLPHAWFEVLVRLHRSENGMLTMGALARQVALTSGGVTRLVDRMAAAGLVVRRAEPTDRRTAYAVITDEGRSRLTAALTVHAANLRTVFAGFSPAELETLDGYLDRLRAAHLPVRAAAAQGPR